MGNLSGSWGIERGLWGGEVCHERGELAKISLASVGVRRPHARYATRSWRTLAETGLAIRQVALSEIKVPVVMEAIFGGKRCEHFTGLSVWMKYEAPLKRSGSENGPKGPARSQ